MNCFLLTQSLRLGECYRRQNNLLSHVSPSPCELTQLRHYLANNDAGRTATPAERHSGRACQVVPGRYKSVVGREMVVADKGENKMMNKNESGGAAATTAAYLAWERAAQEEHAAAKALIVVHLAHRSALERRTTAAERVIVVAHRDSTTKHQAAKEFDIAWQDWVQTLASLQTAQVEYDKNLHAGAVAQRNWELEFRNGPTKAADVWDDHYRRIGKILVKSEYSPDHITGGID